MYQAKYTIVNADKMYEKSDTKYSIAGKCCESGDLIQENAPLQSVEAGDILAVLSTGAYNYSMASNYNRIPKLPVIMVNNGEARIVVRRETYEMVASCDV